MKFKALPVTSLEDATVDLEQLELPEGLVAPDTNARQAAYRYLAYSLARERLRRRDNRESGRAGEGSEFAGRFR